ncbi:MAG: prepilin-type N-terminal cleavage/methylation domain-containing protein [Sedimentisphaerales bacterium]|nr:prepilin-type N-terminal cleavage/methylation domain-containing protein [Sedimentisphaerales bacterium]
MTESFLQSVMRKNRRYSPLSNCSGFTLVELLVGLMVTSIVLTAVATLAFAMGSANDASDDTSQKQAQLRYATIRLNDLIRHCRLVCASLDNDIVLWKSDYNDDGVIDVNELAYIETGSSNGFVKILEFKNCPSWLENWFKAIPKQLDTLGQRWCKDDFCGHCERIDTPLITQCSNAQFVLDSPAPDAGFVGILFDLEQYGTTSRHQISSTVRSRAAHLVSADKESIVDDDD